MKTYEGMFLLHNRELPEEEQAEPEDVVRALIDKCGGTVNHTLIWANRKLAYPVKGNQTGTYVLAWFSAESAVPAELDREVRLSDRMLRHMLIALPALPGADELPEPLNEPTGRRSRADLDMPIETPDGEKPKKIWEMLDYKNPQVLRRMISAQGKLFSRVRTNLEGKNQRRLRREVFRARNMALLPFVGR